MRKYFLLAVLLLLTACDNASGVESFTENSDEVETLEQQVLELQDALNDVEDEKAILEKENQNKSDQIDELKSEILESNKMLINTNLNEYWNKLWDSIAESDNIASLSEIQIAQVNELLTIFLKDLDGNDVVNPLCCFFTSYYEKTMDLDFTNFLYYFPYSGLVNDEEELNSIKKEKSWPFNEDTTLYSMPVPVHKYSVQVVKQILWDYAGLKIEDLSSGLGEVIYLEEYDSFYNFTSDFGPGFFNCTRGEVIDGTIRLYSENDQSTSTVLTLGNQDGRYIIVSYQPVEE